MDCSPPGSSIHEILQARKLEWVAISFSRGSSWSRDQIWVSCTAGRFFFFFFFNPGDWGRFARGDLIAKNPVRRRRCQSRRWPPGASPGGGASWGVLARVSSLTLWHVRDQGRCQSWCWWWSPRWSCRGRRSGPLTGTLVVNPTERKGGALAVLAGLGCQRARLRPSSR